MLKIDEKDTVTTYAVANNASYMIARYDSMLSPKKNCQIGFSVMLYNKAGKQIGTASTVNMAQFSKMLHRIVSPKDEGKYVLGVDGWRKDSSWKSTPSLGDKWGV